MATAYKPTSELLVVDDEGWSIFRIADKTGYTHKYDTIRIGKYNNSGDYRVETLRGNGWAHLLAGRIRGEDSIEWVTEGLERAMKVLFS